MSSLVLFSFSLSSPNESIIKPVKQDSQLNTTSLHHTLYDG